MNENPIQARMLFSTPSIRADTPSAPSQPHRQFHPTDACLVRPSRSSPSPPPNDPGVSAPPVAHPVLFLHLLQECGFRHPHLPFLIGVLLQDAPLHCHLQPTTTSRKDRALNASW